MTIPKDRRVEMGRLTNRRAGDSRQNDLSYGFNQSESQLKQSKEKLDRMDGDLPREPRSIRRPEPQRKERNESGRDD
jgi:hypothetical protein